LTCLTVQHYSEAIQFASDAKSFNYNLITINIYVGEAKFSRKLTHNVSLIYLPLAIIINTHACFQVINARDAITNKL